MSEIEIAMSDAELAWLATDARRFGLFDLAVCYEEWRAGWHVARGNWELLREQARALGKLQLEDLTRRLRDFSSYGEVTAEVSP